MIKEKFELFHQDMTLFDGFSDTASKARFWDLGLNELTIHSFSENCILNAGRPVPEIMLRNYLDYEAMIVGLLIKYADINSTVYPNINNESFDYESKLVGFAAHHFYSSSFAIVPIIELSGKDAEIIISAIALTT